MPVASLLAHFVVSSTHKGERAMEMRVVNWWHQGCRCLTANGYSLPQLPPAQMDMTKVKKIAHVADQIKL
jgi:hypothetical protein